MCFGCVFNNPNHFLLKYGKQPRLHVFRCLLLVTWHGFTLSSDWSIMLFVFIVIGQSDLSDVLIAVCFVFSPDLTSFWILAQMSVTTFYKLCIRYNVTLMQ